MYWRVFLEWMILNAVSTINDKSDVFDYYITDINHKTTQANHHFMHRWTEWCLKCEGGRWFDSDIKKQLWSDLRKCWHIM